MAKIYSRSLAWIKSFYKLGRECEVQVSQSLEEKGRDWKKLSNVKERKKEKREEER